jgi:serine/threonine protein kinase
MEFGGEKNLKQFIRELEGKLIEEKIIKNIIKQLCLGLKEIHKNKLIHRDLTPDNIFIDDNYRIKIGDFGVSRKLSANTKYAKTHTGKTHYNPPEVEKGEKYDYRADIYSLGCVIYELFTLNEYYVDKNNPNKNAIIDINIYNKKWQELLDLLLKYDYHERPFIENLCDNILRFVEGNKKTGSKRVERPGLSSKEVDELFQVFDLFDTNGTGKIDPKELKAAMQSSGLDSKNPTIYQLIDDLDTPQAEKNGGITFDDFVDVFLMNLGDKESEEGIRRIFDLLIDDPNADTITLSSLKKISKELGANMSDEELKDMLERASKNGVELTFQEFYDIMTKKSFP